MGGTGSGRKPSEETIVARMSPEITPVGEGLFLPNYSGVQTAVLKTSIPLNIPEGKGQWIKPYHWTLAVTTATPVVARVYLLQFEVPFNVSISDIVCSNPAISVSGSAIVGIYGPITNNTCANSTLLVQSNSTALTNSTSSIPIIETTLNSGVYYVAVEFSKDGPVFNRQGNSMQAVGLTEYYDIGGGYGDLTNPCPAITSSSSNMPGVLLKRSL